MNEGLLSGAITPKKPGIASWNTTEPRMWSMSQCLEFLELSDVSQKKVFSDRYPMASKEGAAKVRPSVVALLRGWIQHFENQARLNGLNPEHAIDSPYPQLYCRIGQKTQTALLEDLNKAQTYYQKHVQEGGEYEDLKHVETIKFVLLYSLERRLSLLFHDRDTQCKHLPHLDRFVKMNPKFFSLPEPPKLLPVTLDNPHTLAFFAATMHASQKPSHDKHDESEEDEDERDVPVRRTHVVNDVKPKDLVIPDHLLRKTDRGPP
jgi:hypothetical protein